jgi:hypothetical protein
MTKLLLAFLIQFILTSQILGQKLLVCQVSGDTCTFSEKIVNKDEQVVIVADHKGSTTNADIKKVIFEISSIYSIPPGLFTTFRNLEELYMNGQLLQEIKANTFENARSLLILQVHSNLLKYVDENTFVGANNLVELRLHINQISEIPANTFSTLRSLKVLDIGINGLEKFYETTLHNLVNLDAISFHGNPLKSLHKNTFKNNLDLHFISLGHNNLNALSNTIFSHLKRLNETYLNNNNCINKDYVNELPQTATIENDLLKCTISYLTLENDELREENSKILGKLDNIERLLSSKHQ